MDLLYRSSRVQGHARTLWTRRTSEAFLHALDANGLDWSRLDGDAWGRKRAAWRQFVAGQMAPIAAAPQPVAAPRLVDEKDHGSFRLQRLVIEAMPGWSVGLDLFLPAGAGPFVPVLCPCGHGPKWLDDHQIAPQVLARSGFAAALFDMPMFGERRRGNCHFVQGAASAMVGRWSGFYFLLDIIRTADYLATRPDITMDRGIGVTGVSGGGIATLFMPHLDGRVRAIVPVCCTTSLGGHIARGLYTGCQEGYMEGQAAAGLDLHHLMALAAPTPCLVLAGGQDTLFRRQWVEQACLDSRAAYSLEGAADHFAFAFEDTGHHYTAAMAHQAAAWFAKWLSASPAPLAVAPAARHPATAPSAIKPLTEAQLDCGTADATLSMLDCTRQLAAELRQTRAPAVSDDDLRRLLHIEQAAPAYEVEEIPAASEWGHPGLGRFVLHRAGDLPLPVLRLMAAGGRPGPTLVAFAPQGKFAALKEAAAAGWGLCFAADIRGFGELAPEETDYDLYPWCGVDRAITDLLWMLGDSAAGQQTRDALTVISFAAAAHIAGGPLAVYGRGEAAIAAAFAGLLHPAVTHIIMDRPPASFEAIACAEAPAVSRYPMIPHVLEFFDLPQLLAGRADRQFMVIDPTGADGALLDDAATDALFGRAPSHVTVRKMHIGSAASAWPSAAATWIAGTPAACR